MSLGVYECDVQSRSLRWPDGDAPNGEQLRRDALAARDRLHQDHASVSTSQIIGALVMLETPT